MFLFRCLSSACPGRCGGGWRPGRAWGLLLFLCWMGAAWGIPLDLEQLPGGSLGRHVQVLHEQPGQPLDLAQVRHLYAAGRWQPGTQAEPNFGIGHPPVWLRLAVRNGSEQPRSLRLVLGTTWIDQLDVHVLQGATHVLQLRGGDASSGAGQLVPAQGFRFSLDFPPGDSEIYLRAATPDPLVLPLRLVTPEAAAGDDSRHAYGYGFLYGFLIALIAYNTTLALGLRERAYLYYALYMAMFILTNLAYTGHGQAWWWAEQTEFQRYVILVLMALYSCAGLLFARRFLELPVRAPGLSRAMSLLAGLGLLLQLACVVAGRHEAAVWEAFLYLGTYTLLMVLLGLFAVQRRLQAGRYFLAAALSGMASAAVTCFAVVGLVPMNGYTYHAAEFGALVEAVLLALALAHQVRHHKEARQVAEHQARIDPLTGLHNRRAFFELSSWALEGARQRGAPLSLIMLDIDHFKPINDRHGHQIGDEALAWLAQLLPRACRGGDVLARWGGEEFVILLPDTGLEQAGALAERIRQSVATGVLPLTDLQLHLTVSQGVAQRRGQENLEDLLREADACLYTAKRRGRDQVVLQDDGQPLRGAALCS